MSNEETSGSGPRLWWMIWRMAGHRKSRARALQALWRWAWPKAAVACALGVLAASLCIVWTVGDYGLGWLGAAVDGEWWGKPRVAWIARLEGFDARRWRLALEAAGVGTTREEARPLFDKEKKAWGGPWPISARAIGRIEGARGQWLEEARRLQVARVAEVLAEAAARGDDWTKASRSIGALRGETMEEGRLAALDLLAASSRREYSSREAIAAFAPWARWSPTVEQRALVEESLGTHVFMGALALSLGVGAMALAWRAAVMARTGCLKLVDGERERLAAEWEAEEVGKGATKPRRTNQGRPRL